ncbi:MAG: single-stranded DNA-binding protein [Clostridia bacterium]
MTFAEVNILGRVVAKPEMNNINIARFSVAVSRTYTKDNEKVEKTSFIDVDAFGRNAETLVKYCDKGRLLSIRGDLVQDKWTDKDGTKRSKLFVKLFRFDFVDFGKDDTKPDNAATTEDSVPDYDTETVPF